MKKIKMLICILSIILTGSLFPQILNQSIYGKVTSKLSEFSYKNAIFKKTHLEKITSIMDDTSVNNKKVVIFYTEKNIKLEGKEIIFSYYDEKTLLRKMVKERTKSGGVISFLIPASENGASAIFSIAFAEKNIKKAMAFRIPAESMNGGQDSISINIVKEKKCTILNSWAPMQLINFPEDGSTINFNQSNINILKYDENTQQASDIVRLSMQNGGTKPIGTGDILLEGSLLNFEDTNTFTGAQSNNLNNNVQSNKPENNLNQTVQSSTIEKSELWPHKGTISLEMDFQVGIKMAGSGIDNIITAEDNYLKSLGLAEQQTNSSGQVISTKPIDTYEYSNDIMVAGIKALYFCNDKFSLGLHFYFMSYSQTLSAAQKSGTGNLFNINYFGPSITYYLSHKGRFGLSLKSDFSFVFGKFSSVPALYDLSESGGLDDVSGLPAMIKNQHIESNLSGIQADACLSASWFLKRWISIDAGLGLFYYQGKISEKIWPNTPTSFSCFTPTLYFGANFYLRNKKG